MADDIIVLHASSVEEHKRLVTLSTKLKDVGITHLTQPSVASD